MSQDVTADGRLIYKVEYATLARFMQSTAPVQVIQGPVGSGKSKICNLKAWAVAASQKPGPGGLRCTRGAIIRNTYPELIATTMRTWKDTFPEEQYGRIVMSKPAFQHIRVGDVSMEVDFLAMDKEDDVKKLRSSEYTWAYINELQYLPKVIFDEIQSRIEMGRFPAMKDGGPSWHGLWADMNAPDDDHFIAMMTGQTEWPENMPEDEREALRWPAEWDFFMQPPGLLDVMGPDGKPSGQYRANPAAENIKWLAPDAYLKMIRGKTRAWIKSHVLNQVALVIDGDPVWPWFRREVYVAGSVLEPVKGHPIWVSLDFGRKPAALFGQFVNNRVVIMDEMQAFNEGAGIFAPKVKRRLEQKYAGFEFKVTGDPKGRDKTQSDERTAYDIWASHGMPVTPSPVKMNMTQTRVEAVDYLGSSMTDGRPRLLVSPACRTLIVGMEGRYCYERKQNSDQTKPEPKDSNYTHLCFVAGTAVSVPGGAAPIEALRPGDEVSTPFGPRRIIAAGHRVSNTVVLLLSTGAKVRCTPDHPFWTDRGWVEAADLDSSDRLAMEGETCSLPSGSSRSAAAPSIRYSSSSVCGTGAAAAMDIIRAAASFCTALSGRITMALSPPVTMSTTRTTTQRTTILKIWDAFRSPIMRGFTWLGRNVLPNPRLAWTLPSQPLLASATPIPNGHARSVAWRLRPQPKSSPTPPRKGFHARTAGRLTRAIRTYKSAASAPCRARVWRARLPGWTTSTLPVWLAERFSGPTNTQKQNAVRVIARESSPPALVYNITVDDVHCYYAAGALVSNCDALQYMVITMGEGRKMAGLVPLGELRGMSVYKGHRSRRRVSA